MRTTLLLTTLLLTATAHPQWQLQQSHTTADLRGIHSLPNGVAWASGTDGTVLHTEDSGQTWQLCTIPPGAEHLDFRGIQAFDAQTAIAMSSGKGDLSRLYKTKDSCKTWKLVLTNPEPEGFWDAISFQDRQEFSSQAAAGGYGPGVLIGDPIKDRFDAYETNDFGDTWVPWFNKGFGVPGAKAGESLFAASNSSLIVPGNNDGFAFVTGGANGSRLFQPRTLSAFQDGGSYLYFTKTSLPFKRRASTGAFSIAKRKVKEGADLMIVGGDYLAPEAASASIFISASKWCCSKILLQKVILPTTPPHGYRSSVAYSPISKAWITVGPNGTDVSTDDGRNWHALKPAPAGTPEEDLNWNALSLPFVVGPHGRVGLLRPEALMKQ